MEFVNPVVSQVVESLMVPVKKHIGYIISYTKYVRTMATKKRMLDATRHDAKNHMDHNKSNNLEVPSEVSVWLEEVGKIDAHVESISSHDVSCFNLKVRHMLGMKAFKIIQDIEQLTSEFYRINWTDHPIPLGKVDSNKASTSTLSSLHSDFKSRDHTFKEALKALEVNNKSHMIALCGMGGVGKTTMMEKLKKAAIEKEMFTFIAEAVVGEKTDPIVIQQAIAEFIGTDLKETSKSARACKLRKSFEAKSDGGKNKILVILDDVWQFVDLNDIGLSPLPNQGINFKVLITSRDRHVCTMMGVEVNSILKVEVLTEQEARSFFYRLVKTSDEVELDYDLQKIGDDIARKCHGLPIAIKTIASTLKDQSNKHVWEDALSRLSNHDVKEVVHQIFEISYNNLQNEEIRSTLLLCAMFPEDFDTPMEELLRYGWGLQLFNKVYTIREARNKLNTYIERLINANLLIQSQVVGFIKMHDLVRSFVIEVCSKGENDSIIGDMSKWPEKHTSEYCKRISLTCRGRCEFPKGFNFPNLSLLKLMYGDDSIKFPDDLFGNMRKLEVIAYNEMKYPLLPRSLQCSINLRTLCLQGCSLMYDLSSIGNLRNLEVLSLSHCYNIKRLPSTIKNLKDLKLLDLTSCFNLLVDDGDLKYLVKLEEIYMREVRYTKNSFNELAERSKDLFGLEVMFYEGSARLENMYFEKLERFKIFKGRFLGHSKHIQSFGNLLNLVTNKDELLETRIYKLLENTEVLYLKVDGITDLEDVEVMSLNRPQYSSFYNLRVLHVLECNELRYLFTFRVAIALSKLEHLQISSCFSLKELIHIEGSGSNAIRFPKLRLLSLKNLPNLLSLCNASSTIEFPRLTELSLDGLPKITRIYARNKLASSSLSSDSSTWQPFLDDEIVIPMLEKLNISNMENLKDIWPCEFSRSDESKDCRLRKIYVAKCDSLVNLFPRNLMLLHQLEEIKVVDCGSIESLFNIDLECVSKFEEVSSCLRSIQVKGLRKLKEIWRMKGVNNIDHLISDFHAIESIEIVDCARLRNLFTPAIISFDMSSLTDINIRHCGGGRRNNELLMSGPEQGINVIPSEEISKVDYVFSNLAFPSYCMHTLHHVHKLTIENYKGVEVEVVFEMKSASDRGLSTSQNNQQHPSFPYLKLLQLKNMKRMSHVWKCNWSEFLIHERQQSVSSFHNLTTLDMAHCNNIKYLLSPLMAKLLNNLMVVKISCCDIFEEVVSNRDDGDEGMVASMSTNACTSLFPHLDELVLYYLPNLKKIGGGVGTKSGTNESNNTAITTPTHHQFENSQVDVIFWSLCQYSRDMKIMMCDALSNAIPSYVIGRLQMLESLFIENCKSLEHVFETEGDDSSGYCSTNNDEGCESTHTPLAVPRLQNFNVHRLPNLKKLDIRGCNVLQYVFTFSMLESLGQLQELGIERCEAMKVIVNEEYREKTVSKLVVFPRLKHVVLSNLPSLKGFFLGMNEFHWPLLNYVKINACPQMTVFTLGNSISPKLNCIQSGRYKYSLEHGLNFQTSPSSLHGRNVWPMTLVGIQLSSNNLMEIDVTSSRDDRFVIPTNEFAQLQKLERISVAYYDLVEEIFEAPKGTYSGLNELRSVVKLPKLKEVELVRVENLKYIWKNNTWMKLEFPNLTKVSIEGCESKSFEHVFTSSMVGSLLQLQELCISYCFYMGEILKEEEPEEEKEGEECDAKVKQIMLPRLRSLKLNNLPSLKGFCLGKTGFSWLTLNTLQIMDCPKVTLFTKGYSTTPNLKVIDTSFGRCEVGEDLNSFINTKIQEGLRFGKDEDFI